MQHYSIIHQLALIFAHPFFPVKFSTINRTGTIFILISFSCFSRLGEATFKSEQAMLCFVFIKHQTSDVIACAKSAIHKRNFEF